jgi:hypothetical protein
LIYFQARLFFATKKLEDKMSRLVPTLVFALFSASSAIAAEDVIISHHEVLKSCGKIGFLDKTIKEIKTPEGQAILTAVATYIGFDPTAVNVLINNIPIEGDGNQQDTHPFIRSPVGYTICAARPTNLKMGSGQYGIETHGDTTFNSTIVRNAQTNGLAMYMVVPCKASTDTRVQSGFDVTFVRADAGWENVYPNCMATGSHPWLARNNGTTLNVPK